VLFAVPPDTAVNGGLSSALRPAVHPRCPPLVIALDAPRSASSCPKITERDLRPCDPDRARLPDDVTDKSRIKVPLSRGVPPRESWRSPMTSRRHEAVCPSLAHEVAPRDFALGLGLCRGLAEPR